MTSVFLATAFGGAHRERAEALREILVSRGCEVMLGEGLDGERISEAVREKIERCTGVVAILSKREELAGGGWSTHPWVIEEATWAEAKFKRVLRVVEEGVTSLGGMAGDVEQVRFSTGFFEVCIPRIISFTDSIATNVPGLQRARPVEREDTFSIVPNDPVESHWEDEVARLVLATRDKAEDGCFEEALLLSDRAVRIDTRCWRAHINRGVALVHLGRYKEAEEVFDYVAKTFTDDGTIVARALHNQAWLIGRRDGLGNTTSLRKRKDLYMQALTLDNRRIFTRAMVLICLVLLGEQDHARPFLEASLRWEGFVKALRKELEAMGAVGLRAASLFPDWLTDLLYPTEGKTDGGNSDET
ncbi:MAG: hypothetical protein OXE53_11225 [Deltaproteobacteria bacterium]|nr:hypothetical protein [Deltaproteobacteria bacterium]